MYLIWFCCSEILEPGTWKDRRRIMFFLRGGTFFSHFYPLTKQPVNEPWYQSRIPGA